MIDGAHLEAVRELTRRLRDTSVTWALTGSASFALQGVPLQPDDVDVQTTEAGAYELEERFSESVSEPVSFSEGARIRSHFGVLLLAGVRVEVMGGVHKRREDGSWESPVDVAAHRQFVAVDGLETDVPVLSLDYEARAYERLGRDERARLLRRYVE